jgi:hypothetical protein
MMRSPLLRRRPLPHPALQLLPGLLLAIGSACTEDTPSTPDPPDGPPVNVGENGGSGDSGGTGGSSGSSSGAGGSSAADGAPELRANVSLSDDALARQALALLGSSAVNGNGVCKNCHSIGRPKISQWSQLTQAFASACLGNPDLGDQAAVDAMLACFRTQAGSDGQFAPANFGIFAAAARLPWFSYVFEHASGISNRQREEDNFVTQVGMPRSGTPWTQAEFDIVAEWFMRKVPGLLTLVPADDGDVCTPGLDGALATHVQAMGTNGWRSKNAPTLLNFGCGDGQTGSACLSAFPLASASGATSDWQALGGAQIRVLHDNSGATSTYWSRVSADGRYIASGLRHIDENDNSGQILDLQQDKIISGHFRYDATFFPDNSGFVVQQGGGAEGGSDTEPTDGSVDAGETALTCDQSVLASDPDQLTGTEPECKTITGRLGLYQQLAKSVDGSDYWVIHGSYTSDNGGFDDPVLNNPSADYGANSTITLTPLANLGNGYQAGTSVQVTTPRQGDPMLSPSGTLLVTRIKGQELSTDDAIRAEQAGYALYQVNKTQSGGTWSASLQDLGRICEQGGKATFSFDERWMVFHRYVVESDATDLGFSSASDAGFQRYLDEGSSNLYLVDLSDPSGAKHRLTNMPPGKFALFPHFRSDGWIYFVVRTPAQEEYFAATDAALLMENQ